MIGNAPKPCMVLWPITESLVRCWRHPSFSTEKGPRPNSAGCVRNFERWSMDIRFEWIIVPGGLTDVSYSFRWTDRVYYVTYYAALDLLIKLSTIPG